jgi:chromosome partitioning protein
MIAIGNLKGGTGKSTLSINLACALAQRSSVCLIDSDPQGTAAIWAIRGQLPIRVEPMPVKTVDDAVSWLDKINRTGMEHDIVMIDLPAALSAALASAFMAADLVLIPTSLSMVDVTATVRTVHYLRKAVRERHGSGPRCLVVPMQVDCGLFGKVDTVAELEKLGLPLAAPIRRSKTLSRAFHLSSWAGEIAPRSRVLRDLETLADRVANELHLEKSTRPEAGTLGRNRRAQAYSERRRSKVSRLLKLGTVTPETA